MLKYIIMLVLGIAVGTIYKSFNHNKLKSVGMSATVLVLLFFMGVGIGKDPELKNKILTFGAYGFTISFMTVIFSVLAVFIIIRLMRKKENL